MYLKFNNIFFICVIIIFFVSCTRKIICYHTFKCDKNVSVSILKKSNDDISVILENKGFRRIGPIDSIELLFYHYNINLKQAMYDSILASWNAFVIGVKYDEPIVFYSSSHLNYLIIKGKSSYETRVPFESLIDKVNKFGNSDNKLQIENEFQIFWIGFRKGKIIYHIPSTFFNIK